MQIAWPVLFLVIRASNLSGRAAEFIRFNFCVRRRILSRCPSRRQPTDNADRCHTASDRDQKGHSELLLHGVSDCRCSNGHANSSDLRRGAHAVILLPIAKHWSQDRRAAETAHRSWTAAGKADRREQDKRRAGNDRQQRAGDRQGDTQPTDREEKRSLHAYHYCHASKFDQIDKLCGGRGFADFRPRPATTGGRPGRITHLLLLLPAGFFAGQYPGDSCLQR
jgi:hypothetical protein